MARNTRDRFWRAAPALHLKAQTAKRLGGCTAEVTQSHDADGHFASGRLIMVAPEPLALLGLIETLAAMNENTCSTTYSTMRAVRSGSTIRTIGTAGGVGSPRR